MINVRLNATSTQHNRINALLSGMALVVQITQSSGEKKSNQERLALYIDKKDYLNTQSQGAWEVCVD